jgi:hypothetical protein
MKTAIGFLLVIVVGSGLVSQKLKFSGTFNSDFDIVTEDDASMYALCCRRWIKRLLVPFKWHLYH